MDQLSMYLTIISLYILPLSLSSTKTTPTINTDITDYTFYYKSHHYEFSYHDIIQIPNNQILIHDQNAVITTANSSLLSYLINDNIPLNFFDNTHFHQISYKYSKLPSNMPPPTANKHRMLLYDMEDPAYIRLGKGTKECPPGTQITSKRECRNAHDALGLKRNSEWTGTTTGIPAYCGWRNYNSHNFHWNKSPTGNGRSDMYPICLASVKCQNGRQARLLLQLKNANHGMFKSSISSTGVENENNPSANTFSIIGKMNKEDFKDPKTGKYEFTLIYGGTKGGLGTPPDPITLRWEQSKWLTEQWNTASTLNYAPGYHIIKFTPTDISSGNDRFYGLGKSKHSQHCYLDGTGGGSDWFNCIGAITKWSRPGIASYNRGSSKSSRLYGCITAKYIKHTLGGKCPEGQQIMSKTRCIKAHDALGLKRNHVWQGTTTGIPPGCTWRGYSHNFHWNRSPTGNGRSDMYPICHASKRVQLSKESIGTKNYQQCKEYCVSQGKKLATKQQILSHLTGAVGGDVWTPVRDQENNWLQIGGGGWPYGLLHTEIAGGVHGLPGWSTSVATMHYKKSFYCAGKGHPLPYQWLGCYRDTGNRALRYGPHRYGYNAKTCYETCKDKYKYFALQHNGWCCCDSDFAHVSKYGTYTSCPANHMGGGWGNDVFLIGQFKKLNAGDRECPRGTQIVTKGECKKAHDALGLKRNSEWVGTTTGIPAGCGWRNTNSHNFHWNKSPTGNGRGDMYPICSGVAKEIVHENLKCPGHSSVVGAQGEKNDISGCGIEGCSARYTVPTIEACQGKCASNDRCKSFSWASKGGDKNHRDKTVCSLYDSDIANQKWGDNQILCKVQKMSAVSNYGHDKIDLKCPTGSTNVLIGENNDIHGCGLENCEARYSVSNIDGCKEKCLHNRECKSFTWSPQNGDRNHMDKTVCTIYDKEAPNQEWGPNIVMCKIERFVSQLQCPSGSVVIGTQGHGQFNDIPGCGIGGCDSRYLISTIADCKEKCAENYHCKSFSWAPQNGDKSHPGSTVCTVYDSDVPAQEWGPDQILCKIERAQSNLKCPTETVAIGTQGSPNDIAGCGLAACDSRYSITTISGCKEKCVENKQCKSFSWAPQNGDKNHVASTVCTLYDSDVPTQLWGPDQIMCGLGNAVLMARNHKALQEKLSGEQQKHFENMKAEQDKHNADMKKAQEEGMNDLQDQQKQHQKQLESKLQTMEKQRMNQLNKHMSEHKKHMSKHMTGMKSELLQAMKDSFRKNNKQTVLLQKINDLKQKQSDLDLQHQTLEQLRQQKSDLHKQTKDIMQQQTSFEQQRAMERQKRAVQRQKLMQQEHEMKLDEQYQLMNGLKGFLTAFGNLYKKEENMPPLKPTLSLPKGIPMNGDGKGYETRYTKFGQFNRPPPLMPPIPPMPPGMSTQLQSMTGMPGMPGMGHRGLMNDYDMNDESMDFMEVSKCKFDSEFGEICVRYDYENEIVSFDVITTERKELKARKFIELSEYNSTDVLLGDSLVFFDSITANRDFNAWKHSLVHKTDGKHDRFSEYIHHFIAYEYRFVVNDTLGNVMCGANDTLSTLPFDVCVRMNDSNAVIIYFERVNLLEMFNNERLTKYMQRFQGLEFDWRENDAWDEIITFDFDNHIRKCVNLAITKLCVDHYGENVYVIESELQFINQLIV